MTASDIRHHIDIVEAALLGETAQIPPVTFDQVIDAEYIDALFRTGGLHAGYPHPKAQTTYHPDKNPTDFAWIERLLDDELELYGDTAKLLTQPEVRTFFMKWLPQRWNYIVSTLRERAEVRGHQMVVYRNISCDSETFGTILDGENGLGEYWFFDNEADVGTPWGNETTDTLHMTALVDLSRVDWITTMRRNMNYELGDDETEIFLHRGTPVTLVELYYGRQYGPAEIREPNRTT